VCSAFLTLPLLLPL
jgi:membrane associated rhomboid family serine protease